MRHIDKKLRSFVKECAKSAAWNIGVSHYVIDVFWQKDPKKNEDDDRSTTAAEVNVDRRYLTVSLRIYPEVEDLWRKGDKEKVRAIVHHEVAHIATQHLYEVGVATYRDEGEVKDAWETLTEMVGRMSLKVDDLEKKQ